MLVLIKIDEFLKSTEKAYHIRIGKRRLWLAKKLMIKRINHKLVVPNWYAKENSLEYECFIHIPEKIEPVFNQKAIDELKY